MDNKFNNQIQKFNVAADEEGHDYAAAEIEELEAHQRDNEMSKLEQSVMEMEELDSDWETSTDGFLTFFFLK